MNILVAKNGSQLGPFSEADIRAKLASGEFASTDFAWKEGMASWSPLSQMLGDTPAAEGSSSVAAADPVSSTYASQPSSPSQGQYSAPQTYNSPYPAAYQPGMTPFGAAGASGSYAGFWLRFGAAVIDGIIILVINFVVGFIAGVILGAVGLRNAAGVVGFLIGVIDNLIYFSYLESSVNQATVGKMALGLKVTDLNGGRISLGQALGRTLAKYVSALILFIGYIMAGFTERKQALHDMIASTLVVRK